MWLIKWIEFFSFTPILLIGSWIFMSINWLKCRNFWKFRLWSYQRIKMQLNLKIHVCVEGGAMFRTGQTFYKESSCSKSFDLDNFMYRIVSMRSFLIYFLRMIMTLLSHARCGAKMTYGWYEIIRFWSKNSCVITSEWNTFFPSKCPVNHPFLSRIYLNIFNFLLNNENSNALQYHCFDLHGFFL